MRNPWENIELSDYESHMALESVMQLQAMNEIMGSQFYDYDVSTAMLLGVAGGNGLEHIQTDRFKKIYGVDINGRYLKECAARFPQLRGLLVLIQADLQEDICVLPQSDLIIANLLLEYIGYESFVRAVRQVNPRYISCVIQINGSGGFVSDSPFARALACLEETHRQIEERELGLAMADAGYADIRRQCFELPNKKKLLRLDYEAGNQLNGHASEKVRFR